MQLQVVPCKDGVADFHQGLGLTGSQHVMWTGNQRHAMSPVEWTSVKAHERPLEPALKVTNNRFTPFCFLTVEMGLPLLSVTGLEDAAGPAKCTQILNLARCLECVLLSQHTGNRHHSRGWDTQCVTHRQSPACSGCAAANISGLALHIAATCATMHLKSTHS